MGSYEPYYDGDPAPVGAPHELLALPPESPEAAWPADAYKTAALIYAHPDDEMLFAGGLMLAYPEWDWTLICMTDPGREEMQADAIRRLGGCGVRIEHRNLGYLDAYQTMAAEWVEVLNGLDIGPDIVFTHNYRGEYGHHHHVWTHMAAHAVFDNVWDFLVPNWRVRQLRKTRVREVITDDRKERLFDSAYGGITGLREQVWYEQCFSGREFFTQGVVGL